MKVSVLIAAYKAEKWICESVESALAQTLPQNCKLEIIIGVDGCQSTLAAIRKLIDHPQVGIVYFEQNRGTYAVFNSLVPYSSGEYILRHDADDVMGPNRLNKMISVMENDSTVGVVGTWFTPTDDALHPKMLPPIAHHSVDHYAAPGVHLWRRSVIKKKLGGFRTWRCAADNEMLLRVKYLGIKRVTIEDHSLYFYRQHAEGLMTQPETNWKSSLRNLYHLMRKAEEQYYLEGNKPPLIKPEVFVGKAEGKLFENK